MAITGEIHGLKMGRYMRQHCQIIGCCAFTQHIRENEEEIQRTWCTLQTICVAHWMWQNAICRTMMVGG